MAVRHWKQGCAVSNQQVGNTSLWKHEIKQCQVSGSISAAENARAGQGVLHFPPAMEHITQFMFYACCPSRLEMPEDCISALVVVCSRKVTGLKMPIDIYPGDEAV